MAQSIITVWILLYFITPPALPDNVSYVKHGEFNGKVIAVFKDQASCMARASIEKKSNFGYGVCVEGRM